MPRPVGYLRKSKVTSDRHVSWEVQEQEVRELARRHGDDDVLILSDWSKSGRGSKVHLRPEYQRMRQMIEAGNVSAVYSYSLSRLTRSAKDFIALAELCRDRGVPVRFAKEGIALDYSTIGGKLMAQILAAVAEAEADWGAERSADAVGVRRDRGDYLGMAPYGWKVAGARLIENPAESIAPIEAAFRKAGSSFGAARILNEDGLRTRRGALWSSKVVGDVLARAGVVSARRRAPGVKPAADWTFYRLLVCPCGNVMTAMDKRSARYTCYRGRHVPGHPTPYSIAESKLASAIRAEADRLRPPEMAEDHARDDGRRAAIHARRERVLDMYESGVIDKAERGRRLGKVADDMEKLDSETVIVDVPDGVPWDRPRRVVNGVLRALFDRIELGPDLMPVRYVWRVPEWRG